MTIAQIANGLQGHCSSTAPRLSNQVTWSADQNWARNKEYYGIFMSLMMVMMMIHDEVIFAKTLYIPIL